MSELAWVLSAGFAGLLLLGVPFVFALGITSLAGLMVLDIDIIVLAQRFVSGTQSFSLLAIPFFILAGDLMTKGGLSRRLVGVADACVRHVTGGLGIVTVLSATFFAAISGSAPATTAAIGSIMIPEMAKRGYRPEFAAALAVAAGIIGPVIPPSIIFVIWGVIAEESIAKLFLAGIVPGLLMSLGLCLVCVRYALRHEIPRETRASAAEIGRAAWDGKWALVAPFVVLGGIYGGIFTPTEAAVVATVYALFVGLFLYRELRWRDLPGIVMGSMRTTAIVMFIIAAAAPFGWLVAMEQLPPKIAAGLTGISDEPWIILLAVNLLLLLIGMVMDNIAAMIILGGVLIALGKQLGLDPIQLGAIVSINFAIGMATPPFGYALFVGAAVANLSIERIARELWPLIGVLIAVLALVTYVPAVTLFVAHLF
ncbi:TRAP transporter large permease [Stella sp.]|uniref:TRAP transporter large permease n=1 Tax=Stella sp. TaxID=2912054 RepID=UPI0035AFC307